MPSSSHSAAGSNAGFGYQFERALYWLAKSPAGASIGIETDDDVAVRMQDGSQLLEQDKHSIREHAEPFGDRSKDLWNTLSIWIDAVETNQIRVDVTTFLMVTNKVLPDCIAKKIAAANTSDDAAACVIALGKAAQKPPQAIASLTERVLRPASLPTLTSLILKIEMVDGSVSTANTELRRSTLSELQMPEWCIAYADSIADELLGWLHKSTLELWRQGIPAWIQRDHFVNQLHSIIDRRKRQLIRERAEHLIPVTSDNVGQEKGRPFVKQLYLVSDEDAVIDTAIREFVRCNIEKIRLSKEGNITDEDWIAFESALLSRWDKIRQRIARMKAGSPEVDVGYEIFTETTEDHREKLAGSDTEQVYLTSGTHHRLADLCRVGWHPRYNELMKELLKEDA